MNFLSVCAGIEAASLAWHNLGWRACLLSEIEKFPRRVLAHHYPTTRLWGDFTALRVRHLRRMGLPLPQILVGGTPCQAFSVAGLRKSLADARGNLTLSYVRLAHALANAGSLRNAVWENVPGVLNTKDNAFGCFLGAIVGADDALLPGARPADGKSTATWKWRKAGRWPVLDDEGEETGEFVETPAEHIPRWPNAGMVAGPRARAAWRVFDAQYFGLAQRRRRVFVVVDFGNGADPAAVLFESVGVLGNPPPRREAQKDVAGTVAGGARKGGGYSTDDVPLTAAYGGNNTRGPIDVATAVNAHGGPHGRLDFESETFVAQPVAFQSKASATQSMNPGPIVPTLDKSKSDGLAICFSAKDYGGDAMTELAPTLRAGGHSGSHANAGVMPAVAWSIMPQNSGKDFKARIVDVAQPLMAGGPVGGNQGGDYIQHPVAFNTRQDPIHETDCAQPLGAKDNGNGVLISSAVRRLTPKECERLQGFPDNYTLLPGYDADGHRYKALGNSMAVPCMHWIGERIARFMPVANDNRKSRRAA